MGNCFSPSTKRLATISGVKVFTVAELKKATNDFGESFGGVWMGYINPKTLSPSKEGVGVAVAVKGVYLFNVQDLPKWLVDLELLQLNSHPSLVKLIGYGLERTMLFIVCEYFPNGSLHHHIYRESRPKSLPWETRLKISIGAARCLALLHSLKNSSLYKGNLTASEILLDTDFNARVSYFGLEMLPYLTSRSYVSSYEDEPYAGELDMASDVYSFGVILLETLTGLDNRQLIVAKQAIRNDKENIAEMIDPDLENSFSLEAGRRMCEIIEQCLEEDSKKRPSMKQVIDHLDVIAQI